MQMSFQNVKTWHEEIKRLGLLVNHQIVVGNKSDMEGNREVSLTIAEVRKYNYTIMCVHVG